MDVLDISSNVSEQHLPLNNNKPHTHTLLCCSVSFFVIFYINWADPGLRLSFEQHKATVGRAQDSPQKHGIGALSF